MNILLRLFCVCVTVVLLGENLFLKHPINTLTLLERDGYKYEKHLVLTEDRYILALYRILSTTGNKNPKVAFLNHGFVTAGYEWVFRGNESSLGYLLADAGYDVWITNHRANGDSPIEQPMPGKYWDFSVDDLGKVDTSATIDYVLNVTGQSSLTYIGHSLGGLLYFIMCLDKPEYEAKVNLYIGLAPFLSMKHLSHVVALIYDWKVYINLITMVNFNVGGIFNVIAQAVSALSLKEFRMMYLYFDGKSYNETTKADLKYLLKMYLNASPAKNFNQFFQWFKKDYFHKFDYGLIKNKIKYGALHPPIYNLTTVTRAPKYIFYGSLDEIIYSSAIEYILPKLGNVKGAYKIEGYGHGDFTRGRSIKSKLNNRILDILSLY